MSKNKKIQKAAEIIKESNSIVVLTGAGISTESGIPDFRGKNGLWSKYDPNIYANYNYFKRNPKPFWTMHNELMETVEKAEPNYAHEAIAELEKMGKIKAVITQNIDMLHQKAGSGRNENTQIYELHGSYGKLECIDCGKTFAYDQIDTKKVKYPTCDECSGYIKPKVILFGENMPIDVIGGAYQEIVHADCLSIVGSSLTVSPANFIPQIAKEKKIKIIIINLEDTIMNQIADVFLKGKASEIFSQLMKEINT